MRISRWLILFPSIFLLALVGHTAEPITGNPVSDDDPFEMDRPGELENPYALAPGQALLTNYVVAINAAGRDDEFNTEASAIFLDTAVRYGLFDRVEGIVALDTFLKANVPDSGGGSTEGLGYATFTAKWTVLKDPQGEFGVGLAPFVRVPLDHGITGSNRLAEGLSVPFAVDLEGGWDLQGSSSVARTPTGEASWSTEWENQVEIERALTRRLSVYTELELQVGGDLPAWAAEFGIACRFTRTLQGDLGTSLGLGRNAHGRQGYLGLGWRL